MDWLNNPLIATLVMFLWGLAVKQWPALKSVPNNLIPWMNLVIGVLVKLVSPVPAHAAGFLEGATLSLGWLLPPVQVMGARLVYETWGRPTRDLSQGVEGESTPAKPKARPRRKSRRRPTKRR